MSTDNGIKVSFMDQSADPGKDFFRYANGTWLDTTEIPAEYPRWGAFLQLRDDNLEQLHTLMQEAAASDAGDGSIEAKIGAFFFAGMNEAKIESDGAKPIAAELARIDRVKNHDQLADIVARLHIYGPNVFFGFGSGQDYADSSQVIAQAVQSGLGLPDRDYYTKDDDKSVETRAKYVQHVAEMFQLHGYKRARALTAAKTVMEIETALATASLTKSERRNPEANYNKMPVSEFQALIPQFDVGRYLKALGAPSFDEINVGQPGFFKALNELLGNTSMSKLKAYMRWHFIRVTASCLSSEFADAKFNFYGKTLTGQTEQQPRWKRIVSATSGELGDAVGELYVAKHFPPEAKARMQTLVENLREALREKIRGAEWMAEATRENAERKLDAFVAKIGYADKWQDYSSLRIHRSTYVWNVLRANRFHAMEDLAKIGKPVDRGEWHMSPQTVNAYYSPLMNEVVFPAAILQPPFFNMEADDAINYAAIGAVIGHEMTHGFDDKGSQFDASGNLVNWWTDEDRAEFERRITLIKDQYSSFTTGSGKHLIGDLVSGEAAADLGGLKLAYLALQRVLDAGERTTDSNGFTDEQRFFLSFAQLWASKARTEYADMMVTVDPHPPGNHRCNGTLAHMSEFVEAFGLTEDAEMMLPKEKRCHLW